jgi:hypothetical protein
LGSKPFGLSDLKIANYTTPSTEIDVPVSARLSFKDTPAKAVELRGSDGLAAVHIVEGRVLVELEAGGISMQAWELLSGGTYSTGSGYCRLLKAPAHIRPHLILGAKVIDNAGVGDIHVYLPYCRCPDGPSGEFRDGQFFLTAATIEGLDDGINGGYVVRENAVATPLRLSTLGAEEGIFLNLICTTTAPGQTCQVSRLTPAGDAVTIDWGDDSTTVVEDDYQSGITHVYADAGTYAISISSPAIITHLDLGDAKVSCVAGEIGKLTGLTYLVLYETAVVVGAGEIGGLTSLETLNLYGPLSVTIEAGEIGGLVGLREMYLSALPGVTVGAADWQTLINIESAGYDNDLNQAAVDAILQNIWLAKATYIYVTPLLSLWGNAVPGGVYGSVCPPTTGKEWRYDLANGICTPAGPEWNITCAGDGE